MKEKLHVYMIGSSFRVRGGMTSVCKQISQHQFGHGIQVEYIATHEFGPMYHRCWLFIRGFFRLLLALLRGRVDLVHLHMSERGSFYRKFLLSRLAHWFHKPVVLHMHGADFRSFYESSGPVTQAMVRRMLRTCDRVVVLGKHWDQIIRGMEPKTRTLVINNAVSIPESMVRWDPEESRLCYLGVLIPRKGVTDLLEAMNRLPPLPRPVKLTIVGCGPEEENLQHQCRELGLEDVVRFTGWTTGDQKQALLMESQCFVLPSYSEGLPVAMLEAISAGLPVVATDVGSVNEALSDGVNGRFAPVHDPQALAEAIADVIADQQRWQALSAGSRQIARDRFDEKLLFDQLEQLYLTLAEDSRG